MSTVAFDGKTLAADTQATGPSGLLKYSKIHKIDGKLYALTGQINHAYRLFQVVAGAEGYDYGDYNDSDVSEGVVVCFDKKKMIEYFGSTQPIIFENQPMAWGSGAEFARGALLCGKTAKEAVAIASMCCPYTNDDIEVIKL